MGDTVSGRQRPQSVLRIMVASGRYPIFSPGRPRVDPAGVTSAPCRRASAHQPAARGSRKLGTQKPCANTVLAVLRHRPETAKPDRQIQPPSPNPNRQPEETATTTPQPTANQTSNPDPSAGPTSIPNDHRNSGSALTAGASLMRTRFDDCGSQFTSLNRIDRMMACRWGVHNNQSNPVHPVHRCKRQTGYV